MEVDRSVFQGVEMKRVGRRVAMPFSFPPRTSFSRRVSRDDLDRPYFSSPAITLILGPLRGPVIRLSLFDVYLKRNCSITASFFWPFFHLGFLDLF
jgi:hypothetical protein